MQRLPFGTHLRKVVDEFRAETQEQLWASREQLSAYATTNVDRFISGDLGNNLLYTYRVHMLTEALDDLVDLAKHAARDLCRPAVDDNATIDSFIEEAGEYHRLRTVDLLTPRADLPLVQPATYDIERFLRTPGPPANFRFPDPHLREFTLSTAQASLIDAYLKQFGSSTWGAGRMLTRVHINDLLRHAAIRS